jgi:HEAT repeat protein
VNQLIEVTHDDDFAVRACAFLALAAIGDDSPETIRTLIEGIKKATIISRGLLAERLTNIGKPAVGMVITLLDDPDYRIRSTAIGILGSIGPQAKEAIPLLISRLRDKQYTGSEAGEALGRIGGKDVVPTIIRLLEDSDPNVRYHAAISLGKIGPDASEAVPVLLKLLQDEDKRVRGAAASLIDSIGYCDATVIEKLEERMREDKNPGMRRWAADAIRRLKESGKCGNTSSRTF